MLRENLINIYETSFRENYALPALTDYFKQENFTYLEMGAEIAKLHLLFDEAGIRQGDRIALIGRNNPRWCITYIARSLTARSSCPFCRISMPTT